jgi:hypothetical protein
MSAVCLFVSYACLLGVMVRIECMFAAVLLLHVALHVFVTSKYWVPEMRRVCMQIINYVCLEQYLKRETNWLNH